MSRLALETTILTHGVPRDAALSLALDLFRISRENGAEPALVGVFHGQPVASLSESQLKEILAQPSVAKANSANLGVLMHRNQHASTTVAATMEIASGAGIHVFATGGIGGVHRGLAEHLDISADLQAFTRFPVAVVASGVKSILDVEGTRELLETLGIPVIGYRTKVFPAFYLTESRAGLDASFDEITPLASFVDSELRRTGRGILIVNPIPAADALDPSAFSGWMTKARAQIPEGSGRDATPRLLGKLHEVSQGATLRANLALIRANTALAPASLPALGRLDDRFQGFSE